MNCADHTAPRATERTPIGSGSPPAHPRAVTTTTGSATGSTPPTDAWSTRGCALVWARPRARPRARQQAARLPLSQSRKHMAFPSDRGTNTPGPSNRAAPACRHPTRIAGFNPAAAVQTRHEIEQTGSRESSPRPNRSRRTPGRSSSWLRHRPAVRTTRDPEQAEAGRGFNRWTAAGIAGGVGAWVYGAGMVVDFGDRPGRIFTSGLIGTLTTALAANQNGSELRSPGTPQNRTFPPRGRDPFCSPWRKSAFRDRQGGSHVLHWQAWMGTTGRSNTRRSRR